MSLFPTKGEDLVLSLYPTTGQGLCNSVFLLASSISNVLGRFSIPLLRNIYNNLVKLSTFLIRRFNILFLRDI